MNAKDDPHFGLMLAATVNGLAVGSYREMVVVSQTAEEDSIQCGYATTS